MSYHVERVYFEELPHEIIVREDGYMDAYRNEGEPIVDYVYTLGSGECSIEWRDESHDTDTGYERDGAYFCTACKADLPYPLQECWDDYQALVADYGNVPPWDKKPFRCCPNCGREVVDA